jgi:hypothetical protein
MPGEGVPALERLGFGVACVVPVGRFECEPPDPWEGPPAVFRLFRSAVTIEDDVAPVVEWVEGSLAETGPVSGVGNLFAAAADTGGGVATFEFAVDGGTSQRLTTADGASGCEEPFSLPRPCPSTATQGLALDTATLEPGEHSVSGTVIDAAFSTP